MFDPINLYKQLEDSWNIWKSQVTAVSTQTPSSLATGEGLIVFPSRTTGGKDIVLESCGTPATSTLVLSGLIGSEFDEHHLATSRKLQLKSEMASNGLVTSTWPSASHVLGGKQRSFGYRVHSTGPRMEPRNNLTVRGRGCPI